MAAPAQFLFGESEVNELMTVPAEQDTASRHFGPREVFPEPFVAVQGSRNEMVKGQRLKSAAELTGLLRASGTGIDRHTGKNTEFGPADQK